MYNKFTNHYYLSRKNKGSSRLLNGDVVGIVFFVNDAVSSWTEEAKKSYMTQHNKAMRRIMSDAEGLNVYLRIRIASAEISVPLECTYSNPYNWAVRAINQYGKNSVMEYQNYYKDKYKCDEAPIFFVFNKKARSFASTASKFYPYTDEFSVIFRDDNGRFSAFSVEHELMHQFGAMDLYFPDEVNKSATKHLPKSIMNDGYEIDSLTRFLIGWTAQIDDKAGAFLNDTEHITNEMVESYTREQWKKWS